MVSERGDAARLADTLNTLAEIALDEADVSQRPGVRRGVGGDRRGRPAPRARGTRRSVSPARRPWSRAPRRSPRHLQDAFVLADRTGQALAIAQCLRVGGCLAVLTGDAALAVRSFAAAQRVSPSPSGRDDPIEVDLASRLVAARDALGPDRARREWTLGSTLPVASTRARVDDLVARSLDER